jgi:hypothetical protein
VRAAPSGVAVDWSQLSRSLTADGFAVTGPVLSDGDCTRLLEGYDDPATGYRSTIDMARHNFGRGQYRYFSYPLPATVQALRDYFYAGLAPIANEWAKCLGSADTWPETLAALTRRCHREGQRRPTPLILRYEAGDYNCLHQDLYGPIHFPLQVIVMLSAPARDFDGGELILVEQRPRMQSRPMVVHLERGCAAIIPVRERPRKGARGFHRAQMRHGVSRIKAGKRHTLGVIFHDAA